MLPCFVDLWLSLRSLRPCRYQDYTDSSGRTRDGLIGNDLEESGGELIGVTCRQLPAGSNEKIFKLSVMEAGVSAEIGTQHLPSITDRCLLNMNILAKQ
jgi:hypothetical protein